MHRWSLWRPYYLIILTCSSAVCLLLIAAELSAATPARFWFSLSSTDPYKYSYFENSGTEPREAELILIPNAINTLYLWAQPQNDPTNSNAGPNGFLQLQNFSLNTKFVGTDPIVTVENVWIENPNDVPVDQSNPTGPVDSRYDIVIDSDPNNMLEGYPLITTTGNSAGIDRFAGFSWSAAQDNTGIGPDCNDGATQTCWQVTGNQPVWRLGRIEIGSSVTPLLGVESGHLQMGEMAITHVDEINPFTQVVFGDDWDATQSSGVIYSTSNYSDRNSTNPLDTPDFKVSVFNAVPGDVNGDFKVDLLDLDRLGMKFSTMPATLEDGDLNGDGKVDLLDLDILGSKFGAVVPIMLRGGSVSVPEPSGIVLLGMSCLLLVLRCRHITKKLARVCCIVLLGIAAQQSASAAHFTAHWLSPASGDWDDPLNWTTAAFPNNGIDTYSVLIDQAPGAYTVSLDIPVSIDELTLDSSSAVLELTPSTSLTIQNFIDLNSGTIRLTTGSLISGGDINNFGGAIEFIGPIGGALSATTLNGDLDLTPNGSRASLINGATFTNSALIDGVGSKLTIGHSLTLNGQSVSLGGSSSVLEVGGNNTLTFDSTSSVVMSGSGASISSLNNDLVVNQGTISAQTTGSRDITVYDFDNQGTVEVLGGTLNLNISNALTNTGVFRVDNGAWLEINVGGNYTLPADAELQGDGVIGVNGGLSTLINNGTVRPKANSGILEIDGNYTQTTSGVFAIEVDDLTPGTLVNPHLKVHGTTANLAGRLDVDVNASGSFPLVGHESVLVGASTVSGVFDNYRITGLPTNVAQRIAYNPNEAILQFVSTTTSTFDSGAINSNWDDPSIWGGPAPDSTSNVTITNLIGGATLQTINVNAPVGMTINAAHSLSISDTTDPIALQINSTNLSVSTTTTIGPNATVELVGASQLSSESISVEGDGTLIGASGGTLIADVEVGVTGTGDAVFNPDGTFEIDGDYTQGANGVLISSISDSSNEEILISGDISLSGKLQIDASNLTNVLPYQSYTLVTADGGLTGVFDDIEVVGNNNVVFAPIYQVSQGGPTDFSAVLMKSFVPGDATGDGAVTAADADHFAATLLNNNYFYQGCFMRTVFNLNQIGSPQVVDFLDIPLFTQKLSGSLSISLAQAEAIVDTAIANALSDPAVPEPSSVLLAVAFATNLAFVRMPR